MHLFIAHFSAMESQPSPQLCKTFFMAKQSSIDKKLIFRKKFLRPINLDRRDTINYFSISGYKCWAPDFFRNFLNGSVSGDRFTIKVLVKNGQRNNYYESICCPAYIFTFQDLDNVTQYIQNLINNQIGENRIIFESNKNGFIYFKILDNQLELKFSEFLCSYFGFNKDEIYTHTTLKDTFYLIPSFRDCRMNHVGISLNLLFNSHLSSGLDASGGGQYHEITTLLDTTDIHYGQLFSKTVIDRPQDVNFRSQSFIEIELKFINLSTGQVIESYLPRNHYQEISCSISFS